MVVEVVVITYYGDIAGTGGPLLAGILKVALEVSVVHVEV